MAITINGLSNAPTDGYWFQALHTSRPRFRVGTRKKDIAGNEYIYAQGVTANVVGAFVIFGSAATFAGIFTPVLLTSTPVTGQVGVSLAANTNATTNQLATPTTVNWSWYQIFGLVTTANIATTSTVGGALYQSATAGQATVSTAATKVVYGAWTASTSVSNVGAAFLQYPFSVGQSTL